MDARTLGLTGDVMLGRLVDERQRSHAVTRVWGDVLDHLRGCDGLLVNLECCLSTRGEPWTATHHPYHFRADPDWAVPALREAGVDYASLANNHLKDYGDSALRDTLDALDRAGIAHAGAGRDENEAREPAVFDVDGLRVAAVSVTDNTPAFAAGPDSPGVAHVEIDASDPDTRTIVRDGLDRARTADPDLLVASLHWGPNATDRPPDAHRPFARWLADEGVDIVHGHSAHVVHGVETIDDTLVCYDCGDFVDDYAVDPEKRNDRSFLFRVRIGADGSLRELRLLPTEIADCTVNEATSDAADWCRRRMREQSERYGTEFERDGPELVLSP
jgi:poly-gamma-glutamate synthesis protein (capsule biosynthesis protein)